LARSRACVNVVVMSDSTAGASTAAKTPCSGRAPNSQVADCAAPPSAEAPAKPNRPMRNVRLRPR
jgi:hypothetical protein